MNVSSQCSCLTKSASNCAKAFSKNVSSRSFSSTSQNNGRRKRPTRQRREMYLWLANQGESLRNPLPGSTNYLGAYDRDGRLKRTEGEAYTPGMQLPPEGNSDLRPYPFNRFFKSEQVLGENLRELIWKSVLVNGNSVRKVSATFGVSMERVGAIVRLKEIEKEWQEQGKQLARPYAKAIMTMLPRYEELTDKPFESINDLPVHPATDVQIFHPTSESRHFTRADAAKVFDDNLLPADARIPHPELIEAARDRRAGLTDEEMRKRELEREEAEEQAREAAAERKAKREAQVKKVDNGRWVFRITPINSDAIGENGRGPNAVGMRYGAPLMDRKRASVKIPTRVE